MIPGLGWWVVALLSVAVPQAPPCDAPDADPWIGETSEQMVASDALVAFAVEMFGAPVACEGEVTGHFDDMPFGTLTLRFASGEAFTFETMPPRVTVASLRSSDGFEDPEVVMAAFRDYTASLGLDIVWEAASVRTEGFETTEQFWDPDLSLNASASVIRAGDDLVAVRLSKAP